MKYIFLKSVYQSAKSYLCALTYMMLTVRLQFIPETGCSILRKGRIWTSASWVFFMPLRQSDWDVNIVFVEPALERQK